MVGLVVGEDGAGDAVGLLSQMRRVRGQPRRSVLARYFRRPLVTSHEGAGNAVHHLVLWHHQRPHGGGSSLLHHALGNLVRHGFLAFLMMTMAASVSPETA